MPSNTAMLSWKQKRGLPGYLSSRTFARAVISYLVPDASGETSFDQIDRAIDRLPDGVLKKSLRTLAVNADGRIEALRESIEHWYDDHMDRVSGWYKRHVRQFSIGFGILLILAFNANAIAIAHAPLHRPGPARKRRRPRRSARPPATGSQPIACGKSARRSRAYAPSGCRWDGPRIRSASWRGARQAPVTTAASRSASGSRTAPVIVAWTSGSCSSCWLATRSWSLALLPGARFWFDLLGKLGSLRSSGPKTSRV